MSVTFSYFSANGYPAADYLEYPLLLAQGSQGLIQDLQCLLKQYVYSTLRHKL